MDTVNKRTSHLISQDLKEQLRSAYRAKRQALSEAQQTDASKYLLTNCIDSGLLQGLDKIAVYLANDGEIDPIRLIYYAWANGKQVYLPVIHPFHKHSLLFVEYQPTSSMRDNKYGIAEPVIECTKIAPISTLDAIFAPLVAFDKFANRMGMGGGYYDRTLAPLAQITQQNPCPKVIGIAHDCQECPNIPIASWDIPLHSIVTPTRVLGC